MAKSDRQRAIDTADRWFSRWVRISNKKNTINGSDVYCQCYTTKKYYHIKDIQCGHFISRGHFSVRWDETNARPQSIYANKWKSGMPLEFETYLEAEIGQYALGNLKRKGSMPIKWNVSEIRQIAKEYRLKTRAKEKKLGIKVW